VNISVIGTGYVGLVTGTCFAEMGNTVTCVDIDADKVKRMQEGEVPIYEPDLDFLFHRNTKQARLKFTTSLEHAVPGADIIFLALPTPPGEDGSADLRYILGVADQLGKLIKEYTVVVDKSTVPVGTSELVAERIGKSASKELFDVVSNPEFLREGVAVDDFMKPDRVVIGTSSERAADIMRRLYAPFVRQGNPIIVMDERSAEITKYAANSYLAMRISYMNEIANLCERVGANVDEVRRGIGSDTRIGKRFLFPGIGYGGSCFPKDVQALAKTSDEFDYDFKILKAVMGVNSAQKESLIQKLDGYYGKDLTGKSFAIWGLSFKPETDDIREAPALTTIDGLLARGATVIAYDPVAMANVKQVYQDKIKMAQEPYEALADVDALLILTEWSAFRTPNFSEMKRLMKAPIIFDGRNVYDLDSITKEGFYYSSIGRQTINPL
jgi:UDPglucose 6-dehydrogenase